MNKPERQLGAHDFIPEAELENEAMLNRRMLVSKLHEDMAVFRAEVFLKLMKHNSLRNGWGWAVFYSDMAAGRGGLAQLDDRTEVLIAVRRERNIPETRPSSIHLLTQQLHRQQDGGSFMLEEVTIDWENDAQYRVSSFSYDDETQNVDIGTSPYFHADEEGLSVFNFKQFTPTDPIYVPGLSVRSTMPFGHYSNIEDRIYALTRAQEILSICQPLLPEKCSSANE